VKNVKKAKGLFQQLITSEQEDATENDNHTLAGSEVRVSEACNDCQRKCDH
jgi:hypothetical protein